MERKNMLWATPNKKQTTEEDTKSYKNSSFHEGILQFQLSCISMGGIANFSYAYIGNKITFNLI